MKNRYLLVFLVLFFFVQSSFAQNAKPNVSKVSLVEEAKAYLIKHEPELEKEALPYERYYLLLNLAPAALAANETEKAKAFAKELLIVGEKLKTQPGFGLSHVSDATDRGNVVLGLLAMRTNDVEKAKEHLLAAGNVSGSPVLNSFGPTMLLAKQLLEKGEKETVIKYFELCAKFWKGERGRLEKWKANIEQGKIPDFRDSLSRINGWRFAH